jgi:alkylhydroperoxidase family enzyme
VADLLPTPARQSNDVLASLLKQDSVPMETLHQRYGALLQLVRILIGVVPHCDTYLEIWPPAFRTYNLLVPNLLNLPFSVFGLGGAPKDIVGMGMYVVSRTAECPYCSAHTCSFALRRGASPEKMAQALVGGDRFTAGELATIAVARSLGRIPSELNQDERAALNDCFSPQQAEWIVAGMVMMGFLNKFMDAIGVELEASTVAEVTATMGADWSAGKAGRDLDPAAPATAPPRPDSVWKKLSVLRFAPAALRLDRQWQKGVPDRWPAVGDFLRHRTGHDFPVLSRMHNARCIRAVASALRENLDAATSVTGLEVKALAGSVFAAVVADQPLAQDVRALGLHLGLSGQQLDEAAQFALKAELQPPVNDPKARAVLFLARAASPSPAQVTAEIVELCRQSGLSSQAIVELITWISVLQMLHRLGSFYASAA